MASVKISELNEILAITSDDFFPLVDSGSGTTYRATFNTLNTWLAAFGTVSHSLSSDFASFANTASYALTSSICVSSSHALRSETASYFDLTGFNSSTATSASYAKTASVLQGGNGTSWESTFQISSSLLLSASATIMVPRKRDVENESIQANSLFLHSEYIAGGGGPDISSNDWGRIYFSENVLNNGRVVFEHGETLDAQLPIGPNIDFHGINSPGFLWQTFQNNGPYATGSLMFLKTDGMLYLRSVTARNFTSSLGEGLGFQGTASYALRAATASFLDGGLPAGKELPLFYRALEVYPHWQPYDLDNRLIDVNALSIVVANSIGDTQNVAPIGGISTTNDINITAGGGLGGRHGSLPTSNDWVDLFLVYDPIGGTYSTVLKTSGAAPNGVNFFTDIYGMGGWPANYTHATLISSLRYQTVFENGRTLWLETIIFGETIKWLMYYIAPRGQGRSNGLHYVFSPNPFFGRHPRHFDVKLKVRDSVYLGGYGYGLGTEIPTHTTFIDKDGGHVDYPGMVWAISRNGIDVWRNYSANGWWAFDINGNQSVIIDGNPSAWDMILRASL